MRKTIATIAVALLWAPSTEGFVGQSSRWTNTDVVSTPAVSTVLSATAGANDSFMSIDQGALDRKNASRKKFGLKPMSPEEFIEHEVQVQQLALEQEQRAVVLKKEAAEKQRINEAQAQASATVPGFLEKMFGDVLSPDTCESNFDCNAPLVCCGGVCCSGGSKRRSLEGELAFVPVPVDVMPPTNRY